MEGTEAGANAAPAAPATPEAAGVPTSPIEDGFDRIPVDAISDIDAPGEGEKPAAEAAKPDGGKPAEKAGDPSGKDAGAANDGGKKEGGAEEGEGKGDGKLDRFDRHPRFQELIGKVHELTAQLAEARAAMEGRGGQQAGGQAQRPERLPFIDITTRSRDQLREWQEQDPVGYAANLYKQMQYELEKSFASKAEAARTQAEKTARRTAVRDTYNAYEREHPDFRQMWDSGQILDFMGKNPGHNAISAHMALTREAAVRAAAGLAARETEEKVRADFLAKRNAQVIQDGGTLKSTGEVPDELKDPAKYGGRVAAGAERLRRLRAGGTA